MKKFAIGCLAALAAVVLGYAGFLWWLFASRAAILAGIELGMSDSDVVRVAGSPTHDSSKTRFFLPTPAVDVVWLYDRPDPGKLGVLVVAVSFKAGRVVEVRRTPVSRG